MTPDAVRDAYERALGIEGNAETVTLRRYTGTGANRPFFDTEVSARVTGYQPSDLVGDIRQGDRQVIMLADDLIVAQFPMPVRQTDRLIVGGKECSIEALDDRTRRIGSTLIAYELRIRGA